MIEKESFSDFLIGKVRISLLLSVVSKPRTIKSLHIDISSA